MTSAQFGQKLKIAKEDFSLWTNWSQVVLRIYSQFGNKSAVILGLHKVASRAKLYSFTNWQAM